jgi:hypothetical protein
MKIRSADHQSWVSLERTLSDKYSAWALGACVQTGHGDTFRGRNGDLHLLHLERFVAALDSFITNRQTPAQVDGTYDSFIRFSGTANKVNVEFRIGAADNLSKTHGVAGAFRLNQEALLETVAAFKKLVDTR